MRENTRIRERFELSLDGAQVAAVVVGALVVLGAVFALGLNVGKQVTARAPAPHPARAENPLAALDRPPAPPPEPKEPRLSFHEALTKGSADGPAVSEPKAPPRPAPGTPVTGTALNALPPPEPPALTPAQTTGGTSTRTATPTSSRPPTAAAPAKVATAKPAPKSPMAAAVAKAAALPGAPPGAFAVQVGATQSEAEAQRLQRRYAGEGARVAPADVPGKGRWYRVKVGSFPSRAEAEKRLAALKAQGVKGFVTDGR
jgi:DedD protein